MTIKEWNRKIELLEQNINPDGLPVNSPRKFDVKSGHYSYFQQVDGQWIRKWFTIKNLEFEND